MLNKSSAFTQPIGWVCRTCRTAKILPSAPAKRSYVTEPQARKLPSFPARTRFAPSPTGYLHLGSLRTALYNYLLAKATGGQFLLRIEDTDTKRTVPGAEERLCRDLEWAGLQWDEGPEVGGRFGPYRQSERTAIYQEHADKLIGSGHAYRCFCSAERLDELARARSQLGLSTDYDRSCRSISKEEADGRAHEGHSHTVRLKFPDECPSYKDDVYGKVVPPKQKKANHREPAFEDSILVKSDGQPTYHLANVVDDHLMDITHVIRGAEWMPSTFKHVAMYNAFSWDPPAFAHVGLLQDSTGQKLSKRNLDIDLESYRKDGIFPETLINHVALLGWSHKEGSDFLPLKRMVDIFEMRFTKGNTIVTFRKMKHLQKLYAQRFIEEQGSDLRRLVDDVISQIKQHQSPSLDTYFPGHIKNAQAYVSSILKADAQQFQSAASFYERNKNFFISSRSIERVRIPEDIAHLGSETIFRKLEGVSTTKWEECELKSTLKYLVDELMASRAHYSINNLVIDNKGDSKSTMDKLATQVARYLRWALMNSQPGPPIALTMELLGRDETLSRLLSAYVDLESSLLPSETIKAADTA